MGYNPHKPGRPSHTYHTYLIANLRLVLDVNVQAGDQTHSSYSFPGLMALLDALPAESKPEFIRGDCDWGNNTIMSELETKAYRYLFKLRKSKHVKALINKHHCVGNWHYVKPGYEAKEDELTLAGWPHARRVVVVRKRLPNTSTMVLTQAQPDQLELAIVDGPEDMAVYEYAVLVTNLDDELSSIVQHYQDRADGENVFDEIKNQWGWGGYTSRDLTRCRFMARMIALIYNWWTLFVRLANPSHHLEAVTSRPLLLNSVGRLTQSGRQKRLVITNSHAKSGKLKGIYRKIVAFFDMLKAIAPQLTATQCWDRILVQVLKAYPLVMNKNEKVMALVPT